MSGLGSHIEFLSYPVFIFRGCLTQEKIVAGYASHFIVIADFRYNFQCSELPTKVIDQTPGFVPIYRRGNREMERLTF